MIVYRNKKSGPLIAKDLLHAAKEDLEIWLMESETSHTIEECTKTGKLCSTHEIISEIEKFLKSERYVE